jgi:hypothetical protein
MTKLMMLVEAAEGVSREDFAAHWRDRFLPDLKRLGGLQKAVHHHVRPSEIREDGGVPANKWSGVGCYYYDNRAALDAAMAQAAPLFAAHRDIIAAHTHLIVDEIWMYDRDPSHLPIKMFAFFKRQPQISRADALLYYRTTHAAIGESVNRNRTVRYVQNHVALDYTNPDATYDYDGGPEIWFKSMDVALDLFGDAEAMATLGKDEATFVVRSELLNFLTDEVVVFDAAAAAV